MPATQFLCPDTISVPIADCFKRCRMSERCLTKPTLAIIGKQRDWKGIPSTTQLLNGTIMEYLKLTHNYIVNPRESAFMLLGIMHHTQHEQAALELNLPAEIAMDGDRNVIDYLEPDDYVAGSWQLIDMKVWGSYRVAKALGIAKAEGSKPARFVVDKGQADLWEQELQLNRYRIMLEGRGLVVSSLALQVIVRDGNTYIATSRGITEKFYRIHVQRLDDPLVMQYFAGKYFRLLESLDGKRQPDICDDRECWNGKRCLDYCDVAAWCPRGKVEKLKSGVKLQ